MNDLEHETTFLTAYGLLWLVGPQATLTAYLYCNGGSTLLAHGDAVVPWLADNGFRLDPPLARGLGHCYIYGRDAPHEMLLTLRWR